MVFMSIHHKKNFDVIILLSGYTRENLNSTTRFDILTVFKIKSFRSFVCLCFILFFWPF